MDHAIKIRVGRSKWDMFERVVPISVLAKAPARSRLADLVATLKYNEPEASDVADPTRPIATLSIDRDGRHFRHIIAHLQDDGGESLMDMTAEALGELRAEATFYGLSRLNLDIDARLKELSEIVRRLRVANDAGGAKTQSTGGGAGPRVTGPDRDPLTSAPCDVRPLKRND
mmetsp:Transcript_11161/g.46576  ORF Transcript_11161/g.46576 Transcript_11161/m.46576 type:complete len:172 (-) Transcript_11161:88-603(-)